MRLKIILIILPILFLPFISKAQTLVSADSVSGTWTAHGSPYLIAGNITVPRKDSLQLEPVVPVVEVKFLGNYALGVEGRLLALGTDIKNITFSYADSAELAKTGLVVIAWLQISMAG